MHWEYGHNHIVTDSPSRKVHNRTVYSWICYCKTSKIQYYKVYKCWVMIANNLSTSPHGLLSVVAFGAATHAWYSTNRLAFVIFACVKLCISGQWMQLEYGHNCQSRVFHQIRYRTGQFIVEFFVAKQALYSTKSWNSWVHVCTTISAEHRMAYSSCIWECETRTVEYQPFGSCFRVKVCVSAQ